MSTLPATSRMELDRARRRALVVGAVALAPCVVGAFFGPALAAQFFRAYLTSYLFYLGIALGGMAVLFIYLLTGGAWGYLIRRAVEAQVRTLPLLAVLFLPIAFALRPLYLWARDEVVAGSEGLQHKALYLNATFFWVRAVIYFGLWVALAYLVTTWSRRQDETGQPRWGGLMSALAGPGLVIYGITITFASVDWVMSLQPTFRSTIFGPVFASGQLLSGQAFALVVLGWLALRGGLGRALAADALNDLGNLLFTYLVIWCYLVFFQFMLIWIANLRYDVIWYVMRARDGWQWVAWALFVLHFAVPFFCLMLRDVKRDPASLAWVSGLLLVMQLVYMYYQVMPAFGDTTLAEHWMDFLMPWGLGGLWLAGFLWDFARHPVLPVHDANRAAALHLHELDAEEAARRQEVRRV